MRYPMKKQIAPLLLVTALLLAGLCACEQKAAEKVHLPSDTYHAADIDFSTLQRIETVYVPIYSDIYFMTGERRFLLTATLSIRNTSLRDELFVNSVDYYDSAGILLKKYLAKTLIVKPLSSIEFVVENREDRGGAGANFIVAWGTNAPALQPVIQAVMIGTVSQQGISFVTESVTIERKKR